MLARGIRAKSVDNSLGDLRHGVLLSASPVRGDFPGKHGGSTGKQTQGLSIIARTPKGVKLSRKINVQDTRGKPRKDLPQLCQGWGRGFESLRPLQNFLLSVIESGSIGSAHLSFR